MAVYVEGDTLEGQADSGRPPVKIAGVDANGNVQTLLVGTDGSLSGGSSSSSDTPAFQSAITSKTLVRGTAGVLTGTLSFYNPNSTDVFLQVFDAASTGAVTLGSTTPKLSLWLPPLSAYDSAWMRPIAFSSGIVVAPTTTTTGSTAPSSGVTGTVTHAAA